MSKSSRKFLVWLVVAIVIAGSVFTIIKYNSGESGSNIDSEIANEVVATDHTKGAENSDVVLIEYGDFQCPACANYVPIVSDLNEEFGKHITIVFRHFPLRSIHQNAQIASQAAQAASNQDKFWEMHDKLFETQTEWSSLSDPEDIFVGYADELGLNSDQFRTDLNSSEVKSAVNENYDLGQSLGVSGTPSFFLNGVQIRPSGYEGFRSAIREAIQEAEGAGATE